MVALRSVKLLTVQHFVLRCLFSLMFLLSVWFIINLHKSLSLETKIQDIAFSASVTTNNNTILLKTKDLKHAFIKSNGFLAAMRKNRGKTTGSAVCVVDPAIAECGGSGFASFLLYTLDHIILCRALGINRATVFWRACNSVCSRDPTVNSWDWYFEPVNRGLESKVENVFCPLRLDGPAYVDVGTIIDNSFKNRTDVDGFENARIITTQERMRVNKLIQQYVKPNSRIKEKVRMFYHRYLVGFTVLGVHVRGTDHWMETSERRLPSLMSWVKRARSILKTLPRPRKIFIASDNKEVIKKFLAYFGKETVIFTEAVRAKGYHDQIPPHNFEFKHNAADPYEREIGSQVLMDILLLAKCDHFLHTESSVASLASYFNPHMTSYFLQDEKHTKEPKELRERKRTEGTRESELEKKLDKSEDFVQFAECFQSNSAESACPNTAKGIFVSFQEAFDVFRSL
ncbi:uncharacterized protein LOC144665072 [Oculina patagonica]